MCTASGALLGRARVQEMRARVNLPIRSVNGAFTIDHRRGVGKTESGPHHRRYVTVAPLGALPQTVRTKPPPLGMSRSMLNF
ncbi:hypothetical protein VSX64_19405 [Aurantimonas sp. C2-6-R+9]|uniref:hypothetical protein n=1 Tax=unclassified Aurantimonas TaxID=2638230 RepID=UPI002E19E0ED|nr:MULTISPECIES: hypothetical protein [unclassified Aurantimonas]MEC5292791.1 hypothetical protein [Aurantimonas sp. C2-3-R2]MEC5383006.1 hypothetical protein [Aurantimonas sp. C2-6-R+9]MEC5413843.1 hypothetical protein [Aurantimonas sp. C2-4-R8]